MTSPVRKPSQRDVLAAIDRAEAEYMEAMMLLRFSGHRKELLPILEDGRNKIKQDRYELGVFWGEPDGLD